MLNNFFSSQTKTVTFGAVILATSTILSGILGLIRDRLLAGRFGAGPELDVYFTAFRIPDFVYGILIVGGITGVFLPVFAEYFQKKEAWELANNVLNCFLVLLVLICGILVIFTPQVVNLIAPGFSAEQKSLTTALTRIMFFSPIFFGLSSVFSGILHYFNRFLIYSLAPILYNLSIIAGILFFVPLFGIYGLAYGVILGAFLYFLIQLPSARISGFYYMPIFNFKSAGLKKIFKLMIPRTLGTAIYQTNLIIITAIASTLAAGSIAIFNFSNNLQNFPVSIIGLSFAVASFPVLSRMWADGQIDKFLESFASTFRQILFFIIPASFFMFLLRTQIVRLILGTGQFGELDIKLTAASLGLFAIAILFYSLNPLLVRVFYSFQDTRTPVIIGVISIIFNIGLSFLFVWLLSFENLFQTLIANFFGLPKVGNIAILGLSLALSFSGIIQAVLLLIFLHKKVGGFKIKEIFKSLIRILTAAILTGFSIYFVLQIADYFLDTRTFFGVFWQTILAVAAGVFCYLLFAFLFKLPELKNIKSAILNQFTQN